MTSASSSRTDSTPGLPPDAASPLTTSTADSQLARSRRLLRWALICAVVLGALAGFIMPTWKFVAGLSGIAFATAAGLFGLALAALPIAVLVLLGAGLFLRVESLVRPRTLPVGMADKVAAAGAVLLSLVPALWPFSKVLQALISGGITIRQPVTHHFTLLSDPLTFWENVGYWLIASAALFALAAGYWRSRWRLYRQQHRR